MKLLICLLAVFMLLLPAQEVEDALLVEVPQERGPLWYEKHLNDDGSLGEKNRDIISALFLLAMLANGETPSSKEYGKIINNCADYLTSQVKEKNSVLENAFILYALIEMHEMTGIIKLKESIKNLKLQLYKSFKGSHFATNKHELLANYILARTLSQKYSDNGKTDGLIVKKLIKWLQAQKGVRAAIMSLHLKRSKNVNEKTAIKLAVGYNLDKDISNYLDHMILTKLCFEEGGKIWQEWNRFHQKELVDIQNKEGSWPGNPAPDFIEKSEVDAKLCNSLLATLSLTVYYRYLPSSKVAVYGGRSSAGRASAMARYGGSITSKSERYSTISENRFRSPLQSPLSTFSADVDTASYSNVRRYINNGAIPPADAVRIEEMVNYFQYERKGEMLDVWRVDHEMAVCPWNSKNMLLKTTLSTDEIETELLPPKNLVFLVDVSGSMNSNAKLPLLKKALSLLVFKLTKDDTVSIVTYAGTEKVVLDSTSGDKHFEIIEALDRLNSSGGTNGSAGIEKAYEIAAKNFIKGGINRVLLCTDGDFNVGIKDISTLKKFIAEKAKTNVFLTVMGFGQGSYRDDVSEQLTNHGNGQAFYIDTLLEAKKALIDEMGATLKTLAKDVKLQIEFNPGVVESYRLVGYENRLLNTEDFENDKVDAGDVGSGHQVTAFYEIKLRDIPLNRERDELQLKYQEIKIKNNAEMLSLKIRYKNPEENNSKMVESSFNGEVASEPGVDWKLGAAAALTGILLRDSKFAVEGSLQKAEQMVSETLNSDKFGYRNEFKNLISHAMVLRNIINKVEGKEGVHSKGKKTEESLDLVK